MSDVKIPKEILVYVCDYNDGEPIFAVANKPEEIDADLDGEKVGVFTLNRVYRFKVSRGLVETKRR